MLAILFTLLIGLICCWRLDIVQRVKVFCRIYAFSKTLRGPSILQFIRNTKREKVLPFLDACARKYGTRYGIWFGKDFVLFLTGPEDIKTVLSSQELIFKSKIYQILKPWLGDGLLISVGEKWQRSRKLLTPAFHFNILMQFQGAMNECGEILVGKLETVANNEAIDIYPFITLFALDVICETALGIKKNAQENSESEYVKAVQGICEILHFRSFNFFLRNDFTFQFSQLRKKQDQLLEILHGETNRIISSRKTQLQNSTDMDVDTSDDINVYLTTKKRFAFLDMLLIQQMEGKGITDQQIREEVDTFMFEGHDTTSSALSFALYELSQNPKVQQIAYEEALEFKGRENEPMKYLEGVIKETLRLYPSVPFYARIVKDENFSIGDLKVPKGVTIANLAYALHRDPNVYSEPERFMPERFLGDDESLHPFAHVPFSAGPRNCIGQKFAMLEMKCTLAKLIRAFQFNAANQKPELIAEIILKSSNGVLLKLVKRK